MCIRDRVLRVPAPRPARTWMSLPSPGPLAASMPAHRAGTATWAAMCRPVRSRCPLDRRSGSSPLAGRMSVAARLRRTPTSYAFHASTTISMSA
eukprot:11534755-Alexandrium_andersonii.AAC.1